MLISSKDFFWLALSLGIVWVSFFLGWSIFYLAMILRDVKLMTASARKKMQLIDDILNLIKKKTETTASYLPPLIEGASKLAAAFREKKKTAKKK